MEIPENTLGMLRWIGFAQRKAADEWVRERGLTAEQGFTIGYLRENPGVMQRDIAQISRTTAASVSSMLQGLEKRGLIERRSEPGDDRSKRVYATDAGIELVVGFDQEMAAVDERILAPLDEHERKTLHELVSKVVAQLPEPTRP